jgi:hypothetical protein
VHNDKSEFILQPYDLRFIGRVRIVVDEFKGFKRIIDVKRGVAVLFFHAPADNSFPVVEDRPI